MDEPLDYKRKLTQEVGVEYDEIKRLYKLTYKWGAKSLWINLTPRAVEALAQFKSEIDKEVGPWH